MKNVQSRLFFILYIMWFYLYLMTTSLFEQHGYHMQPRFIEMICSNASIPYRMVKRNEKEKEKEKEKEERNKWYVEHDEL